MPEKNINLIRKVTSHQSSPKAKEGDFKEVAISEEKVDDDKLKNIYEELFYIIPKEGDESHESILIQSNDRINPEVNENLDNDIRFLEQELLDKNEEYVNKTLPELNQIHPIYPNGIFIQEGNTNSNTAIDPESTIWFVQQGLRRPIIGANKNFWTNLIRKAIGNPIQDSAGNPIPLAPPFIRYSTPEDIMTIKEGQDIATGTDISIDPIIAKEEQTPIYSTLELSLHCLGKERFYEFGPGEGPAGGVTRTWENKGYWWLDTEGHCEMTYERDTDPGYSFSPDITTKIWKGSTWIGTKLSRDASFYGGDDPLSQAFYGMPLNIVAKDIHNLNDSFDHVQEWGSGNKFPSITGIKDGSRVYYKMKAPQTSTEGGPLLEGEHQLSGVDEESPQQLNLLSNYYDRTSNYGNKMIQSNCYGPLGGQCFGNLGPIPNSLQELLNDPSCPYYRQHAQKSYSNGDKDWPSGANSTPRGGTRGTIYGKVYGQPILKAKGKYAVLLGGYRRNDGTVDYMSFLNLEEADDFIRVKSVDYNDDVSGYSSPVSNPRCFEWFRSPFREDFYNQPAGANGMYTNKHINNPKLYFPGLQGYRLNWQWTDIDVDLCSFYRLTGDCSSHNDDIHDWANGIKGYLTTNWNEGVIGFNPPSSVGLHTQNFGNSNYTLGIPLSQILQF